MPRSSVAVQKPIKERKVAISGATEHSVTIQGNYDECATRICRNGLL
jgi:hypothetical protein